MPSLLFDLDGTLLNSDAIHEEVFREMWTERGLPMPKGFYAENVHGRLNEDIFREFLPDEPDPKGLSNKKEAAFRDRLPCPFPAMPGVAAFIEEAAENGWKMAIVTNAMRLNAEAMLNAIGLRAHFSTIIIGEECSRGKPDPEPYLAAMRALDVAAGECIAFEDSPSGMKAAHAAGAFCIGVQSSLNNAQLRAAGAHLTIKDFTDPVLREHLEHIQGAGV